MDKMDIAKGLIFKGLNIYSKDSLEDRVIIQKKVYLLQQKGIDLGYEYNWYLKGPYSPTLTKYVYDKLDTLATIGYDEFLLNDEVVEKIETINKFEEDKPNNLSKASWYELLASILYIYNNHYMWGEVKDKQDIINILKIEKPKYSDEDGEVAFDKLIKYEYIKV